MTKNGAIYLDHAATTPVDPQVLEAMLPYFGEAYGNPSSVHAFGRAAEKAVEQARRDLAEVLNCAPREIIFTSCGSEADNLALRGTALAARAQRGAGHLVTTPVEHHAVGHTARQLAEHFGFKLTVLPVDEHGRVDPEDVAEALRPDTALVSVMLANNEVGTIQPVAEIAALARARGVLVHTDAVQAAGQLAVDVARLGVDLLSLGAHKFYGPKGVGALYVRQDTALLPTQTGGGHERGLRAGTHNVPYIVGMARALQLVRERRQVDNERFTSLRNRLLCEIPARIPKTRVTGHPLDRLPNHASFAFHGVDGNELLMHLDVAGIAASSGSACKTGDPEPSEVLLAMGLPRDWALGSLRLTIGRGTTVDHIERVLEVLPEIVARLRALSA